MGHKQPEARLALLMLQGAPWGFDEALSRRNDNDLPHGGALGAISSAIGGLCGWVEGERVAGWIQQALKESAERHPGEPGTQPRQWPGPMLILETALRLREAAQDATHLERSPPRGQSLHEYVFCLSHPDDCARLDAERERQGLAWSEENMIGGVKALIGAMDQELSRLGGRADIVSACAPELAARLELAHGAEPDLLAFLSRWRDRIRFPTLVNDLGCVAYQSQRPDQESFEMSRLEWSWMGAAGSSKGREDFPWGFWLAWSAPRLLEIWGEALGAPWSADAALARDISAWGDDGESWGREERALAAAAAVALERMALKEAASPAPSAPKKISL